MTQQLPIGMDSINCIARISSFPRVWLALAGSYISIALRRTEPLRHNGNSLFATWPHLTRAGECVRQPLFASWPRTAKLLSTSHSILTQTAQTLMPHLHNACVQLRNLGPALASLLTNSYATLAELTIAKHTLLSNPYATLPQVATCTRDIADARPHAPTSYLPARPTRLL